MVDRNHENIDVATATDEAYLPYAAAMAATLARSRLPQTRVTLTVLHTGVSDAGQERVKMWANGIAIRWLHVTSETYGRLGLPSSPALVTPQYFRCLLPELFPPTSSRVIYLDADTLVFADLAELWRADLEDAPVGAVRDWLPTVRDAVGPWERIGLDPDAPYFNSGLLVVDLEAWRQQEAALVVLQRCEFDSDHLVAQNKWPQHDQYGLNVVFHRRWKELSPVWNHFSERSHPQPKVVHFVGNGKPGTRTCRPAFTRAFVKAVESTAWAGWRPVSLRAGWRLRFAWASGGRVIRRADPRRLLRTARRLTAT